MSALTAAMRITQGRATMDFCVHVVLCGGGNFTAVNLYAALLRHMQVALAADFNAAQLGTSVKVGGKSCM